MAQAERLNRPEPGSDPSPLLSSGDEASSRGGRPRLPSAGMGRLRAEGSDPSSPTFRLELSVCARGASPLLLSARLGRSLAGQADPHAVTQELNTGGDHHVACFDATRDLDAIVR